MKKHACGVIALAGLSVSASAQSLSVELTFNSGPSVSLGDTVTGSLVATFTGFAAGSYISSFNIDLVTDQQWGEVSNVSAVPWNNPALGFDGQGTASGANIIGIEASQFSLIPPITMGSPILVMSFDLTITSTGPSGYPLIPSYYARTAAGAPFPFSVTGPRFDDQPVIFGVDAFVPAPGVMAAFAATGLLASRRRRGGLT